jgi:cobyrinic acid a,c-diamide synthase
MRQAVKVAAEKGMPVYAECGGLMYLGESIRDFQGNEYPMVGALSVASRIDSPRLSLGYRTIQALDDGPILRRGETVRGHEFHWSVLSTTEDVANAYCVEEKGGLKEGSQKNKLLASYIHLHLGSLPHMASNFIGNCCKFRDN